MGRAKFLPHLLALMLCCAVLTVPALAGGGPEADEPLNVLTSWADCFGPGMDPETDTLPEKDEKTDTTEIIEKPDTEPAEVQQPLAPEGNMTLVDNDISSSTKERQFLTVTSRKGNYFYLIIDRANDGTENVHFLNQVDEADLLPLVETSDEEDTPAACSCTEKCRVGAVNTACEICAVKMTGCVGKEPEPEPKPESEEEQEPAKKGGVNAASIVLAILLAGGGAVYFLKFRKKKPDVRGQDDLDDYNYGSEDEDERENEIEDEGETEDPEEETE